MSEPDRRRRRLRRFPAADTDEAQAPHAHPPHFPGVGGGTADRDVERGLRGLIGGGSSQLSVTAALRARDASRPTAADLAEAEEQVVLVRRNWMPRDGH